MWRSRKDNLKRRMLSGILACLLVATSLTNTVGVISAFAAQGTDAPRVSYKYDDLVDDNGKLDKLVQINVQAENESFLPGSEMVLKVYVQNLSDQYLTGGSLKWNGKGLEEAGFLDEEEEDIFNGPGWDNGDGSGSDTTGGQDGGLMEELGSFGVTGLRKSVALRVDDTNTADGADGEEGQAPEEKPETIGGMDFTEITEIQDSGEDDSDEPETDDEGKRIKGIELAPGEVYETRFYGTVEDLDSIVTRKVTFEFLAGVDGNDQKLAQDKTEFTYNTGMALVLPVEFEDGPALMTNELNTLYIRTRFEDEKILDEYTWDVTGGDEDEATPADAQRHEITVATMSNGDGDNTEGTTPANMKYSIVTYGAKLLGIEAWRDEDKSDWGEVATGVSFRVADGTEPGVYFGQVTTSIRRDGKSYKTTQGFHFFVLGDGQIVLKGNVNGAEIQVKGDRESFPEGDMLSLKVTEVPEEKMGLVQEAMAQKADELGVSVDKMMAVDIKVIADGTEQELRGDVQVTFSNLKMQSLDGSLDSGDTADTEEVQTDGSEEIEEFEEISNHSVFGLRKAAAQQDASAQEETTADDLVTDENQNKDDNNEESSLAVWHFNEDQGSIDEMDSETNDDGDVVMTTEHFSIFIVVDMDQLGGNIFLTVQHWGQNIETINADGTTNPYFIMVDEEPNMNHKVPQSWGSSTLVNKRYGYHTKDTVYNRHTEEIEHTFYNGELYSPDTIMIPNKKEYKIEELSKVCLATAKEEVANRNYDLREVWVSSNPNDGDIAGYDNWTGRDKQKYSVITDGDKTLTLIKSSVVRLVYEEKAVNKPYTQPVTFYDYNVTGGGRNAYDDIPKNDTTLGNNQGTNTSDNFTGGNNKMGVGQESSGNRSIEWNNSHTEAEVEGVKLKGYLNKGNNAKENSLGIEYDGNVPDKTNNKDDSLISAVVRNEVQEFLTDDYKLQFHPSISQPGFFEEKSGTKKFTNYELGFKQKGDTYTLSMVRRKGEEKPVNSGLDKIKWTAHNGTNDSDIYSNHFWPLDDEVYDPQTYPQADRQALNASDGGGTHNWHFGMHYAFTFRPGDYTGPMNFYFRGDDDFWLFVDGKRAIDLGGIHFAVGQAIDMRAWLEQNGGVAGEHRIDIYFMERGGFGSCCYMQFTLPNCIPIDQPKDPQTQVTVKKEWDDYQNPNRPDEIEITLWQMYNGIRVDKGTVTLKAPTWEYTWTELPVSDPNDPTKKYTYEVIEKNVPEGYDSQTITPTGNDTDGWVITVKNKLKPEVKVKVTKEWVDNNNECGNRPDELKFQLYADGEPLDKKVLTLSTKNQDKDDSNIWFGEFEHLPKYRYKKDSQGNYIKDGNGDYIPVDIVYDVKELNGQTAINDGGTLMGVHGTYTVAYTKMDLTQDEEEGNYVAHVKITNTHICENVTRKVIKRWEEIPADSNITVKATIGLYFNEADNWKQVSKDANGNDLTNPVTISWPAVDETETWERQWTNLPKYNGESEEIQYGIFEVDGNGHPITEQNHLSEIELGNYKYEVTSTDATAEVVTITNKLIKARIRIAKWIDNWDEELDVNDLAKDEFIVNLSSGDGFETGVVLKHAGIENNKALLDPSKFGGYIEVVAGKNGTVFTVDEILPKEYQKSATHLLYMSNYNDKQFYKGLTAGDSNRINAGANTVTVMPGDDGLIIVHNTFGHKDYFHNENSVTNVFQGKDEKPPVKTKTVVVLMDAFLAEETDKDRERKYQDEERLM